MAKTLIPEIFLHLADESQKIISSAGPIVVNQDSKTVQLGSQQLYFADISHIYLSSAIAKYLITTMPPPINTEFDKAVNINKNGQPMVFAARIIHIYHEDIFVLYLNNHNNLVCVFIPDVQEYELTDSDGPQLSYDDNLAESILHNAIAEQASDIHIKPRNKQVNIQFRIDGCLQDINEISISRYLTLVSKFKIMANMDIAERRMPQDGSATIRYESRSIDLRFSTVPTINGESLVVRILDPAVGLKSLTQVGFSAEDERKISAVLHKRSGLVLVTGPTGSGKSTTLYAAMDCIRELALNTISIEDPVEYRIDDIKQIEVNPQIGNDFSKALRHVLRHDPDVIIIGEIRDKDTARIAVESALTGHLVISTLHTRDCAFSISRLLEMGLEAYQIRDTIKAVLAQRLVRKYCDHCHGAGDCEYCNDTGFKGRMIVYEWLEIDKKLKELIKPDFAVNKFVKQAKLNGMRTLAEHAEEIINDKLSHRDEVYIA